MDTAKDGRPQKSVIPISYLNLPAFADETQVRDPAPSTRSLHQQFCDGSPGRPMRGA